MPEGLGTVSDQECEVVKIDGNCLMFLEVGSYGRGWRSSGDWDVGDSYEWRRVEVVRGGPSWVWQTVNRDGR